MAQKSATELGQELLAYLDRGIWGGVDEKEVNRLVNEGADLKQVDAEGNTALLLAAHHGLTKIGIAFVNDPQQRSDINAMNKKGYTPLLLSMQPASQLEERSDAEYLPIAKALLQRDDVDVNKGSVETKQSPLTRAAERGLVEYVRDISLKGGDLDFKDWQHENALTKAKKYKFGDAAVKELDIAYAQREKRREAEREQQAIEQLKQTVVEVTGIVGRGAGVDMLAPEKASFPRRGPRKYTPPV